MRPPVSEMTPAQDEDEQQFAQRLSALHEVSLQLSLAPTHDDLCRLAVELGQSRLGFERLGIWFVDPTDREYMIGTFGIDEAGRLRDERSQRLLISSGAVRYVLLTGNEPLQYSDDTEILDDRSQVVGRGSKAVAALWDGQEIIGHISTDNLFSRRPITPRQRDLLVLFARTVGHLSTLKRREEALRRVNQELQERNEDLNAFAHMVAHDLQNPLALMIGIFLPAMGAAREAARMMRDAANLRVIGTSIVMYASDHNGAYAPHVSIAFSKYGSGDTSAFSRSESGVQAQTTAAQLSLPPGYVPPPVK